MDATYRVQRVILPSTGAKIWFALDRRTLEPHVESRDFALYLNGRGRSENTIRTYTSRLVRFLNWAAGEPGCDWKSLTRRQMLRFKWSIEGPREVVRANRVRVTVQASPGTVNVTITAVIEFLRFAGRTGLIEADVANRFMESAFLIHAPDSFDPGEGGQRRRIRTKELRAKETIDAPHTLSEVELTALRAAVTNARDRFLLEILDRTGMRVGEVLGLRRSDMHFLPDSTTLGCDVPGAHVHVVRREGNVNGALAKSTRSRHIPVESGTVRAYRDYRFERDGVDAGAGSDYVFVNLKAGQVGAPMSYPGMVGLLNRLARRAWVRGMHAHVFRHTAASRWINEGTSIDVVQALLGHASQSSTQIYTHVTTEKLRAAVAAGAKMQADHK